MTKIYETIAEIAEDIRGNRNRETDSGRIACPLLIIL